MKYLVLLMTLLLPISGTALAQIEEDIPDFIQAKKPVLCAPLTTILETLEKAKEIIHTNCFKRLTNIEPVIGETIIQHIEEV